MKIPSKATGAFVPAQQYNELREVVLYLHRYSLINAGGGLELVPQPYGRAVVDGSTIVEMDVKWEIDAENNQIVKTKRKFYMNPAGPETTETIDLEVCP
jgi:hypothetical protein